MTTTEITEEQQTELGHDGWNPTPTNGEVTAELGNPFREVDTALPCSLDLADIEAHVNEELGISLPDRMVSFAEQATGEFSSTVVSQEAQEDSQAVSVDPGAPEEPVEEVQAAFDAGTKGFTAKLPTGEVIVGEAPAPAPARPRPRPYPRDQQ